MKIWKYRDKLLGHGIIDVTRSTIQKNTNTIDYIF